MDHTNQIALDVSVCRVLLEIIVILILMIVTLIHVNMEELAWTELMTIIVLV